MLMANMFFLCLSIIFPLAYYTGLDQLCKDAEAMIGHAPGIYWRICWKFVSPLLIAVSRNIKLWNMTERDFPGSYRTGSIRIS